MNPTYLLLTGIVLIQGKSFASISGRADPLNWQSVGCFNLSDGDSVWSSNQEKGNSFSAMDWGCASWRNFGSKCRSGLPFFRFLAPPSCVDCLDRDACQSRCLSKGLDVAGLIEEDGNPKECRCGASLKLQGVWGSLGVSQGNLRSRNAYEDKIQSIWYLLPNSPEEALNNNCALQMWVYADRREEDGSPAQEFVDRSSLEDGYIRGIVAGVREAVPIEDSDPSDFQKSFQSINERTKRWHGELVGGKVKRLALPVLDGETNHNQIRPLSFVFNDSTGIDLNAAGRPYATLSSPGQPCFGVTEPSVCWDNAMAQNSACGEACTADSFVTGGYQKKFCSGTGGAGGDASQPNSAGCPITCGVCRLYNRPSAQSAAVPIWPGNIIPFWFDTSDVNLNDARKQALRNATSYWNDATCIQFTEVSERPSNGPYAVVVVLTADGTPTGQPAGCSCSPIGEPSDGVTTINLGSCADMSRVGSIMHELGHLLGLMHTHMRPDRDEFIKLKYGNIISKYSHDFEVSPYEFIGANGLYSLYDYGSIMHYSPTQAMNAALYDPKSNPGTFSLLKPLTAGVSVGQRRQLSTSDIQAINMLYSCETNDLEVAQKAANSVKNVTPVQGGVSGYQIAAGAIAAAAAATATAVSGTTTASTATSTATSGSTSTQTTSAPTAIISDDPNAPWRTQLQYIAQAVGNIATEELNTAALGVGILTDTENAQLLRVTYAAERLYSVLSSFEAQSAR